MDPGQHPDGAGEDQDARHQEQGAEDLVAQPPAGRGERRPQHVPAPVAQRVEQDAEQNPDRGGDDEDQGAVGEDPESEGGGAPPAGRSPAGERGVRHAPLPTGPPVRLVRLMMARAARFTATEITASTSASSARVATAKPVPSACAPSSWVRIVAAMVPNGWEMFGARCKDAPPTSAT